MRSSWHHLRYAHHEAGHALIAHLRGWQIGLATIKPQLVDPSSRELKLDGACNVPNPFSVILGTRPGKSSCCTSC